MVDLVLRSLLLTTSAVARASPGRSVVAACRVAAGPSNPAILDAPTAVHAANRMAIETTVGRFENSAVLRTWEPAGGAGATMWFLEAEDVDLTFCVAYGQRDGSAALAVFGRTARASAAEPSQRRQPGASSTSSTEAR